MYCFTATEGDLPVICRPKIAASPVLVRHWLQKCLDTHEHCFNYRQQPRNLPSKLIDISNADADHVYLRSVNLGGIYGAHVTLSHKWGSPPPPELRRNNLQQLSSEIKLSSLPKTFRPTIEVARWAGVNYIWIDSFYIFQDSESGRTRSQAGLTSLRTWGTSMLVGCSTLLQLILITPTMDSFETAMKFSYLSYSRPGCSLKTMAQPLCTLPRYLIPR
jgi:hypothetical protein